ncbi:MAG: MotA/TolQ/ExbB proton channel family protein [Deltaproteobacteria bacterium]|nr:MotA/TolQ/ExbB proton channel family protein [Deltaproteobacteria bacterium]
MITGKLATRFTVRKMMPCWLYPGCGTALACKQPVPLSVMWFFHFMEQMTIDRQLNQDLLTSLVNRETSRLSRNINIIYVLASIAPLLGLLGTVGGMISTFDAIAMYGTGNARAMAQGISAALITTQSGLFVSIPGLFMASFLHRRIGRIAQQLDEFRAAMMKELNLNFQQAMG